MWHFSYVRLGTAACRSTDNHSEYGFQTALKASHAFKTSSPSASTTLQVARTSSKVVLALPMEKRMQKISRSRLWRIVWVRKTSYRAVSRVCSCWFSKLSSESGSSCPTGLSRKTSSPKLGLVTSSNAGDALTTAVRCRQWSMPCRSA